MAADFHSRCDGVANTLTVIKAANTGHIFGGFTQQPWSSEDKYFTDPKAYIFSLVNRHERPFKVMCSKDGEFAIYGGVEYGPSFGRGDISIVSDSNCDVNSQSDFGYTYEHLEYTWETVKARTILAGSEYFQAEEIEVYTLVKQESPFTTAVAKIAHANEFTML